MRVIITSTNATVKPESLGVPSIPGGTVYQPCFRRLVEIHSLRGRDCKVNAVFIGCKIDIVYEGLNYLAECECDYRKVVSVQAEYGYRL